MPFLTLEDPNEKIKGSRDPLGIGPVWVRFSRHVVTNLTTPSGSVRGFTILILARYFTQLLYEQRRIEKEDALDVFLRMELLGAYARYVGDDSVRDIRGIERVKKFYREGKGKVTIQGDARGRILADQKVYGLWGLFSVPARVSGLIPDDSIGVTPLTREFIESNYWERLKPVWSSLAKMLVKGGQLDCKRPPEFFNVLIDILTEDYTASERVFYGDIIRDGKRVEAKFGNSQELFSLLLRNNADLTIATSREDILRIAKKSTKKDPVLSESLYRIADLEALLAITDVLFSHILMSNNKTIQDVAAGVKARWGNKIPNLSEDKLNDLYDEIKAATSTEIAASIRKTCKALIAGDYNKAIRGLLAWNRLVMAARSSAPWVTMGDNGRVNARFPRPEHALPDKKNLKALWINSYYIDSLKAVNRQLEGVRSE